MDTKSAIAKETEFGFELQSPLVGSFRAALSEGSRIAPGVELGRATALGRQIRVLVGPRGPRGFVDAILLEQGDVDYGRPLYRIAERTSQVGDETRHDLEPSSAVGLVIRSSQPGRVYLRSEPGAEPYVQEGQIVQRGHPLVLIEVMKMFTPVAYGEEGLPERARILRVLVEDEQEIETGEALFEIEAA